MHRPDPSERILQLDGRAISVSPFSLRYGMGRPNSRRPRKRLPLALLGSDAKQSLGCYPLQLELLEDRIQLGDTVLGISAVALWSLHGRCADAPALLDCSEHGRQWHHGQFFALDMTDSLALDDARGEPAERNNLLIQIALAEETDIAAAISFREHAPRGSTILVRLTESTLPWSQPQSIQSVLSGSGIEGTWTGSVPFSPLALGNFNKGANHPRRCHREWIPGCRLRWRAPFEQPPVG